MRKPIVLLIIALTALAVHSGIAEATPDAKPAPDTSLLRRNHRRALTRRQRALPERSSPWTRGQGR